MAAGETSNVNDNVKKLAEKSDYNPKLDFFSEQFDPLLALRTPGVTVPVNDAKIYDNIHQYKSAHEEKPVRKEKKITQIPEGAVVERRWLPHQSKLRVSQKY